MTADTVPTPADLARTRAIARLRDVAALCEANPTLPVPAVAPVAVHAASDEQGIEQLDRIAGTLTVSGWVVTRSDRGWHHEVVAGAYRAFHIDEQAQR